MKHKPFMSHLRESMDALDTQNKVNNAITQAVKINDDLLKQLAYRNLMHFICNK